MCLRITPFEVLHAGFKNTIGDFLKCLSLGAESIHLVVDYEVNDPAEPEPKSLLASIPHLNEWQTLSVASGAFPSDLQEFQPGNTKIPRNDWLVWKRTVLQRENRVRKPSFSDYSIQYGLYKEPVEHCNPSASIRYTLEEDWLIMRGEGYAWKANVKPD